MFVLALWGCRPIVAPEDFNELASFMYEHFDDAEYLEVSLAQIQVLLEERESEFAKGYRVNDFSLEAIQTVEPERVTVPDLLGISKSVDYSYPVDDIAYVNFAVHPKDVFVNPNAQNDRWYVGDPDCFVRQECDYLEYEAMLERSLPLNVVATLYFHTSIRWIDTPMGPTIIQKRWLTADPEVNVDWLHLNAGYGLSMTLPTENNQSTHIETIWGDIVLGDLPLPEDAAFLLATDVLESLLMKFEEYLDENPID